MRLRGLMAIGLAVAAMVAIIPVITRGQIPTTAAQADHRPVPPDIAKLEN